MVIFWLILVGIIFLIIFRVPYWKMEEEEKQANFTSAGKQRLDGLIDELAAICQVNLSKSGRTGVFQVAESQCTHKWYHYRAEHKISGEILDSKSSLGKCTCSPDRFYYGIDTPFMRTSGECERKYATLSDGELSNPSGTNFRFYTHNIEYVTQRVIEYTCIMTASEYPYVKSIPLENIKMYRVEGNVHYTSDVSGGGANLGGAVAGGLLFGGAGAVVGSKVGTNIHTETVKTDDRKLVLYYLENNALEVEKIDCNGDIDDTLEVLRKLMPQKDEAMLQLQSWSNALQ